MSSLKEVKLGNNIHYILDETSGFWLAQILTDPQSATITSEELTTLLQDYIRHIPDLRIKLDMLETKVVHYLEQLSNG